jgi:chromosome segregation ATPase
MVPTPAVLDTADPDDLFVIVAPEDACDGIDTGIAWRARFEDGEKPDSPELADVAQLRAEIGRLERELERKEAHLDAVVTRNEQILAERTRAYQNQLTELDARDEDDVLWHGRRQEWEGFLARARRWMRGLLP